MLRTALLRRPWLRGAAQEDRRRTEKLAIDLSTTLVVSLQYEDSKQRALTFALRDLATCLQQVVWTAAANEPMSYLCASIVKILHRHLQQFRLQARHMAVIDQLLGRGRRWCRFLKHCLDSYASSQSLDTVNEYVLVLCTHLFPFKFSKQPRFVFLPAQRQRIQIIASDISNGGYTLCLNYIDYFV